MGKNRGEKLARVRMTPDRMVKLEHSRHYIPVKTRGSEQETLTEKSKKTMRRSSTVMWAALFGGGFTALIGYLLIGLTVAVCGVAQLVVTAKRTKDRLNRGLGFTK